jgi:hypothetical protein
MQSERCYNWCSLNAVTIDAVWTLLQLMQSERCYNFTRCIRGLWMCWILRFKVQQWLITLAPRTWSRRENLPQQIRYVNVHPEIQCSFLQSDVENTYIHTIWCWKCPQEHYDARPECHCQVVLQQHLLLGPNGRIIPQQVVPCNTECLQVAYSWCVCLAAQFRL